MNTFKAVLFASTMLGLVSMGVAADTGTQVFRSVDAQGNVVFTDTQSKGSKPVDIQAPSSVGVVAPPAVAAPMSAPPSDPQTFAGYQALVITQPAQGEALNNTAGDVNVSVDLVPALRTDLGHGLTITLDGKPVSQNSARMNVALNEVERGEHVLEAFVVNSQGQVVFQSAPARFSLQRTSILQPGRAPVLRPVVPAPH